MLLVRFQARKLHGDHSLLVRLFFWLTDAMEFVGIVDSWKNNRMVLQMWEGLAEE